MSARHLVLIVVLAAIWGGAFTLIRNAVPALGPLGLSAVRLTLAAVIMLAYLQATGQRVRWRRDRKAIAVIGCFGAALPFPLFAYGATQWSAGFLAVINATVPLWGAVIARLWLGDRITPAAIDINDTRGLHVGTLTRDALRNMGRHIAGADVLVCGASYRQDVGDTRYSGSEIVVRKLTEMGAEIRVHDPYVDHWWEFESQDSYPAPGRSLARFFRNQEHLAGLLSSFGLRAELVPVKSFEQAFEMVAAGAADAVAANRYSGDGAALPMLRRALEDANPDVADAAARGIAAWPTATDPVKESARTSRFETSSAPTLEPAPVSTLSTPAGSPASAKHSAMWRPVRGAS